MNCARQTTASKAEREDASDAERGGSRIGWYADSSHWDITA
jgi:hypothetical protein